MATSNTIATSQVRQFDGLGVYGPSGSGRRPEPKYKRTAIYEAFYYFNTMLAINNINGELTICA